MITFYETRKNDDMASDSRHGKRRLQCSAHLHHHIELVLLISGKAVAFADTTRYELEAGDLFIAFPNQIHHYETEGGERYFLFIVNPDLIPELAKIFTGSIPCSSLLRNAATPELIHLMEQLTKPWDDQKYRDMARRGYYLAMFSEILAKLELTTTLPDVGETVGSAKVAEDAPYELAQANWAVSETDDMMDAVEAPYEEGMKVWMAADLLAKEGYIFSPELQVYVNGKPADTDFLNPLVYASGSVVYSPHEAALILLLDDESDDAGDDFIPGGGEGEADAPLTGDEGVVLYAVLAVVTLAGAVVLLLGKRRMA